MHEVFLNISSKTSGHILCANSDISLDRYWLTLESESFTLKTILKKKYSSWKKRKKDKDGELREPWRARKMRDDVIPRT